MDALVGRARGGGDGARRFPLLPNPATAPIYTGLPAPWELLGIASALGVGVSLKCQAHAGLPALPQASTRRGHGLDPERPAATKGRCMSCLGHEQKSTQPVSPPGILGARWRDRPVARSMLVSSQPGRWRSRAFGRSSTGDATTAPRPPHILRFLATLDEFRGPSVPCRFDGGDAERGFYGDVEG